MALLMTEFSQHLPFIGQFALTLPLQGLGREWLLSSWWLRRMPLLCWLMIEPMLGVQEKLTFMLFRSKRLCSLKWGGKCLSTSFRNSLPISVLNCSLQGGLNRMTLRFLLRFVLVGDGL